ncbi:MAG TPA: AAA family ATPase [Saprospiraceae bacterium]|nr:AAA family ATPase [Saprospiraceae bacterium]HNT21659.1 AAA family ATPase [Saprospiraceae bacterium]
MNSYIDLPGITARIQQESGFVDKIREQLAHTLVGQEIMVERLLIGLLCKGHILLEGLPGLAKTLAIKSLANAIHASFQRIQFTPDLLPADIIGTMIFNPGSNEFHVRKGPIFANFILADEINRAPAKVQSALLEAMQEKQVTIGKETYRLEEPFLVLATQNPIEQEGTYPLPEAQVDRFMLKVLIGYPSMEEERQIIRMNLGDEKSREVRPVVQPGDILRAREVLNSIYMDEKIEKYILDIVFATRKPEEYKLGQIKHFIQYGASPRASINLALASKAVAFIQKRGFVIPDDVRYIAKDVLRHRIGLTYEAEAENKNTDHIIGEIISKVEVP